MASWTDKIPTFNPYVAQQPVDAMLKVGMYKQQKYEEGVQRIQTAIDNVAGLDVGRDVDKNYLQSKLNALGNNLNFVAAGDFSNFQLVNSVNGMTKDIVKDEYVQAAVSSTAIDRKQMSLIEEARKKGTLTPHAEYNYQLQRNKYYSNPNLKQEDGNPINYSGRYNPSWDIDKHMLEAIKAVGDSNWTADNVFKLDGNGRPMHNADGSPMYSEFAIREKRAGKFNENITAAINTVLSRPEAKQELGMQGVYNYRGYDNIDDFISQYKAEKEKGIALGESQKLDLMSRINTETNPMVKKQYQAQLNKLEANILELSNTQDARIVEAEGYSNNLDNYKAALQTQRKRNDYMKMGVTETFSKEYIKSIPYEVAQEKIKAERDWFMSKDASARGWKSLELQEKRDKLSENKWEYVKTHPPGGPTDTPPTPGPVEPSSLYVKTIQEADDAQMAMDNAKNDFVFKYIKALNFSNGRDLSDDQVRKAIATYSKNDPNFVSRMYDKGKQDVTNHPENKYYTNLVTALPKLDQVESNLTYYSNKINDLNNDPDVIAAGGKQINTEELVRGLQPITIQWQEDTNWFGLGGRTATATLSPQDILNFNLKARGQKLPASVEQQLKNKFGKGYGLANTAATDPGTFRGMEALGGTGALTENNMASILKLQETMSSEKFKNILNAKEKVLQEKGKGNLPLVYTVYPKDAKGPEVTSVDNRIDAVLSTFKEGDINVSEFTNLKKNNTSYTTFVKVDRDNDNKISLALYDGNSLVKEMPITKAQMDFIKGSTTELPPTVSRIQRQYNWSGEKATTNATGTDVNSPNAYKGAWFKPEYFFSKFNRKDVLGADVIGNELGQVNVYFYVKDAAGNMNAVPYKIQRGDIYPHPFNSLDEAEYWVKNVVTRSGDIDNIINNSKPTN